MKQRLVLLSFVLSLAIMVAKFYVYFLSGSTTLLTDALESIINVVAACFAYYSIYLASLPKDLNHPYGHGKIEFFASGLEGVLILLAAAYIFLHASQHLYTSPELKSLDVGMAVSFISAAVNGLMGYFLVQKGRSSHSPALIADGKHLRLDAYNGILVVAALALTNFTHWFWVDSVASFLFAGFMCWQGVHLIRESVAALMDETNPALFQKVTDWVVANKKEEWIDLHNLRVQQYGGDLHIDCHVTLPYYFDLNTVHQEISAIDKLINQSVNHQTELFIHADPCLPACCHYCKMENCPVRAEAFRAEIKWNMENVTKNQKHFQ